MQKNKYIKKIISTPTRVANKIVCLGDQLIRKKIFNFGLFFINFSR